MRRNLSAEEIFLKELKTLIRNLLIDTPNYKNGYYGYNDTYKIIVDTKERAQFILDRIDETDHLVKLFDNNVTENTFLPIKINNPTRKTGRTVIDLTGKIFYRLTVLEMSHVENSVYYWKCLCTCGNTHVARGSHLKDGSIRSCGCILKEGVYKTHGKAKSKEYDIWRGIIKRCTNPNHHAFKDYGGRDIKVCERWKIFENFMEDMGPRPEGCTVDRTDNDGNYEPSNCRWASRKEQANNRRNNVYITYKGETKSIGEWAELLNIPKATISSRLRYGHGPERVLSTKKFKRGGEV